MVAPVQVPVLVSLSRQQRYYYWAREKRGIHLSRGSHQLPVQFHQSIDQQLHLDVP